MEQLAQQRTHVHIGVLEIGIVICTAATAIVHLYLAAQPDESLRIWFLLNGLGYIALLSGLWLPALRAFSRLICNTLIVYAALTIALWFILGQPYDTLGTVTKIIEFLLIIQLFLVQRPRAVVEH